MGLAADSDARCSCRFLQMWTMQKTQSSWGRGGKYLQSGTDSESWLCLAMRRFARPNIKRPEIATANPIGRDLHITFAWQQYAVSTGTNKSLCYVLLESSNMIR